MIFRTTSIIGLVIFQLCIFHARQEAASQNASSFIEKTNLVDLKKGRFLVASKAAGDPRFRQSVILMVHYDKNGAMGLIINHPTDLRISEAFPKLRVMKGKDDFVHIGGPVEMAKIFMLIQSPDEPETAFRVFEDVYLGTDADLLKEMAGTLERSRRFRVYSGYAGWAPGQLEGEMARGSWHVLEGDRETIFEKPADDIWKELIDRTGGPTIRTEMLPGGYSFPRATRASAFAAACAF